jgi:hypothetical protein
MASRQNGKLTIWQVDKMASWQDGIAPSIEIRAACFQPVAGSAHFCFSLLYDITMSAKAKDIYIMDLFNRRRLCCSIGKAWDRSHTHTHTHARTHAHTRTHTHTHSHTRTHTRTHTHTRTQHLVLLWLSCTCSLNRFLSFWTCLMSKWFFPA